MRIGERLAAAIEQLGLNLKQFSDLTGVPYRTLQDYVRLQRDPKGSILGLICTRSRVSAQWLLTGEGDALRDADQRPSSECVDGGLAGPVLDQDRRLGSLVAMLGELDPESREAVISDAFTRAATAQQLADLRQAVATLTAKTGTV